MNYRLAAKEDLQQLAVMRWDFQTEDETEIPVFEKEVFVEKCAEFLSECFEASDWYFWIAEQNGKVAAHIFAKTIKTIPRPARFENGWCYITNVYTKPEFRGRGIGAELLRKVKTWATEKDFELILLSPSDESDKFYKREGFAPETDFYQLRLREF